MAKWDLTTRQAWKKSVVAQELEKYILETAKKLELMVQAQTAQTVQKLTDIKDAGTPAAAAIETVVEQSAKLADDGEADGISEEEHASAQQSLLDELKAAAQAAADLGNIKLAYRIERTISEISGD